MPRAETTSTRRSMRSSAVSDQSFLKSRAGPFDNSLDDPTNRMERRGSNRTTMTVTVNIAMNRTVPAIATGSMPSGIGAEMKAITTATAGRASRTRFERIPMAASAARAVPIGTPETASIWK